MVKLLVGDSAAGRAAATGLAKAEGRSLVRVDLSQVVSKYVGETEENLDRVFSEAQATGAVLLFDEADALFGKRTGVKDSHDRYANLDVASLLQRIERYEGLVILTSNRKQTLDEAFLRRMRYVVDVG